jgi:hypothetical protein
MTNPRNGEPVPWIFQKAVLTNRVLELVLLKTMDENDE